MTLSLPDPKVSEWNGGQRNFDRIAQQFPIGSSNSRFDTVTTLSADSEIGTIAFYAAATNVVWMLRFNGTEWDFVGGPPLFATVLTFETTASTSYADLATAGPAVTVPEDGTYVVRHGARIENSSATGISFQSFAIGATAASDSNYAYHLAPANNPSSVANHSSISATAADSIACKYKVSAGTGQFGRRWIEVTPKYLTP